MDSELTFKAISYGLVGLLCVTTLVISLISMRKESRSPIAASTRNRSSLRRRYSKQFWKIALMILILMRSVVLHAADDSESADVPRNLTNQFTEGQVLEVQELLGDGEIVYIAVAQFGDLFVITRARPTEDGYAFNKKDILEIFMLVDGKPKSLWVRQSGV